MVLKSGMRKEMFGIKEKEYRETKSSIKRNIKYLEYHRLL